MLSVNLRRIYYVCDKVVIRNLRGSRHSNVGPNPGLDKRIQAFQEHGHKIQDNDAEEFIEQSESTFLNVGRVYDEHMKEAAISKKELRHHIIKDKYFKEHTPNLLTWSEKEQIRYLATEHPDEWTPEKIADSFPVTVNVVKRLLKFPWKPASEERIARHDASAMRNWRELKEGTLAIPKDLREHFLKFTNRSIPPLNRKSIKDGFTHEEKLGEFARIIQKCAKETEATSGHPHRAETNNVDEKEEASIRKDSKRTTLNALTLKIRKRIECGAEVNLPDKMISDSVTVHPSEPARTENIKEIDLFCEKSQNREITTLTQCKESDNMLFTDGYYPNRIRIPRKVYKKGATYKINDCFYDDDGRFLYRVLGMTEN